MFLIVYLTNHLYNAHYWFYLKISQAQCITLVFQFLNAQFNTYDINMFIHVLNN